MPRGSRGGRSFGGAGRSIGRSMGSRSFGRSSSFGGSRIRHTSGYRPRHRSRTYHHRRPGFRSYYRPWYRRRRRYYGGRYHGGWGWWGWGGGSDFGQVVGCILCSVIFIPIVLALSGVFTASTGFGTTLFPVVFIAVIGFIIIAGLAATKSGEETGSNYIPVSNDTNSTTSTTTSPTQPTYTRTPTTSNTTYTRTPAVPRQEPQIIRTPQTGYYGTPAQKARKTDDYIAKSYDVCPTCGSLTEPEDFFCTNCGTKLK